MKNPVKSIFHKPKIYFPDDYIKRLRCSLIGEGMLPEENIFQMDYAIKNMPNEGSVIEIGIYGGLSTNVLLHLLSKNNKTNKLFNTDVWIYEGFYDHKISPPKTIDGRDDVLREDYTRYIKEAYLSSIKTLSKNNSPHSFHLSSDDFFEAWNTNKKTTDLFEHETTLGGPIAFAYIDGNHSYQQTKKDFENVMKSLVIGGFILFDDSESTSDFGSAQLVKEIAKNKTLTLVDNRLNHLFVKL